MKFWRTLTDDSVGAADGLATDEAIMLHHGREETPSTGATLRLYDYTPHCALIGRYQNLEDEIDVEFCERNGIQVGRRPTGGGAIIMGPGQLAVAVAMRASTDASPRELLRRFAAGLVAGLARLDIRAAFRSKNDLEVDGRKIAGLGLYIDPQGAVLFHSSLLVDLDVPLMLSVLRIPGAKLSDKARGGIEARITTVSRELGRPIRSAEVREVFRAGFVEALGIELIPGELDSQERARRDELVRTRYGCDQWVRMRSPQRDARGTSVIKTPEGLVRFYVGVHGDVIKSALVVGDFNLLPPGVARLETALRWCRADPQRIGELAASTLEQGDLGVPPEMVSDALWEATARALELQQTAHPIRIEGSCYVPDPVTASNAKSKVSENGEGGDG